MSVCPGLAVVVLLAAFLMVPLGSPASAAPSRQGLTFTVSPTQLEFTAEPGARKTSAVNVINESPGPLALVIAIEDLQPGRPDISARSWLKVDRNDLTLKPGESRDVMITLSVPREARAGGAFATVYFRTAGDAQGDRGGLFSGDTSVGIRVATTFFITVKRPELVLEGAAVRIVPVSAGKDLVDFWVFVENRGNLHFFPRGVVEVKDTAGAVVAQLELADSASVLPGLSRTIFSSLPVPLKEGDYVTQATVEYGWRSWQAEAAGLPLAGLVDRKTTAMSTFNSTPRLQVKDIRLVTDAGKPARFEVSWENTGDVEVLPAGFVELLTRSGARVFQAPIARGSLRIGPHASHAVQLTYEGVLPKGEYTVSTRVDYNGPRQLEGTRKIELGADVIPPTAVVPVAANRPQARFTTSGDGPSLVVWVVGAAVAVVAFSALAFWLGRRFTAPAGPK